MQNLLEAQADRIEDTFWEFGLRGQVFAGVVLPQIIVYRVQTGHGQRIDGIQKLREELAMRLEVAGVLISRNDGYICVEVPRADRQIITIGTVLAKLPTSPPAQTALLGTSNRGEPLLVHFPSPNVAHILIAGMTGSGKTELLRTMLVSLTMWGQHRDTVTYLIDPKGRKLAGLAGLRSVMGVCGFEQAPGLLDHLIEVMERRGGWSGESHVYLFIDELADLVLVDRSVEVALTRLVQRGREAGIHVIAATQRPSAQIVQGLMRANFPVRIAGAVNSATEAAIATGMAKSGAELLLGRGDMALVYQGKAERFQAAFCSPEDLDQMGALFTKGDVRPVQIGEPESLTARLRARLQLRGPGRPADEPTEGMINWALGRLAATGVCSQRALRDWHKAVFGSDVNPPRAAAAIKEAKRRLNSRKTPGLKEAL